MRTGGAGSRLLGPAGLLGYRMPIAAAPHGPRRRRGRAGAAGGNRGCPRSTLGSCRLRLGPAPRWDMHSHMHGSSAKLVGSCDGSRARESFTGPGAPGEVSSWRRARSSAAITRRAADANNHNSVVNKRQQCAGDGIRHRS